MEPYCFTTDFHASVRRLSISGCSWKPDCSGSKTGAPTPIVCCTTTTGSPPPSATSVADAIFGRDSACGGYWISSGPPKYSCWTSMSTRARRGVVIEFSSADRAQPSPVDDCPSIIAWEDPAHEWHRCTLPMESRHPRWVARDSTLHGGLRTRSHRPSPRIQRTARELAREESTGMSTAERNHHRKG